MAKLGLGSNRYSIYAFLGGVCLLALVLFIPALHGVFSVVDVSGKNLSWIAGLAFLPTLFIHIRKMIQDKTEDGGEPEKC